MPELPEVETVCRGLEPAMAGAVFTRVEQRRADLRFPFSERFVERLTGRRLMSLARRAKYLVGEVEGGDRLVMHLGMSGRFTVDGGEQSGRLLGDFVRDTGAHDSGVASPHDHVVFHMAGGTAGPATITYNDPRRFGFMLLIAGDAWDTHKLFAGLGVEPLSNGFHADYLAARAVGRTTDLKAFLLDQRIVAGLGNIYVSEALFRAGLSPNRKAGALADKRGRPTERAQRLVPAIREVLTAAIAAGGSSLRDFAQTDGSLGYFQHRFAVYDRADTPCPRVGCDGTVKRIVQAGRSTYYCGRCQR